MTAPGSKLLCTGSLSIARKWASGNRRNDRRGRRMVMRVRAIVAMWLVDAGAGRSCSVHRIRRSEPFCTTRLHLDCWKLLLPFEGS